VTRQVTNSQLYWGASTPVTSFIKGKKEMSKNVYQITAENLNADALVLAKVITDLRKLGTNPKLTLVGFIAYVRHAPIVVQNDLTLDVTSVLDPTYGLLDDVKLRELINASGVLKEPLPLDVMMTKAIELELL